MVKMDVFAQVEHTGMGNGANLMDVQLAKPGMEENAHAKMVIILMDRCVYYVLTAKSGINLQNLVSVQVDMNGMVISVKE